MDKMKNVSKKREGLIASLALAVGVASVNSACYGWFHQPKVPQSMQKFKK